jgi:NADH dehydrogenase
VRAMSAAMRRDIIAGGVAGFIGGVISGWAMQAQGLLATTAGLIGLASFGAGLIVHLSVSVVVGATFGAVFRYQPLGYAATITSGVLYALLWWIAGVLTLVPLLRGQAPTWTAQAAAGALPNLVGHLVYGALTGLAFYVLVTWFERRWPNAVTDDPWDPRRIGPVRRVVILGGGFGGVSTAQRLEQIYARDPSVEITLISHSNYLLFTPMLAEVAASGLEAQHISAPVRAALFKTRFVRAGVEIVDCTAKTVTIRQHLTGPTETIAYEHLVLALGAIPNFFNMPGLEDHAFTLKTLQDATRLRNHVIAQLERADAEIDASERRRQLCFVVAGGGFAGTEMVAELFDLVHSVLRYYPNIDRDEPRFVLVHSGNRILPEISSALADYALRKLRARGIEFELNVRVSGASHDAVRIGERHIETHTLVWTAGNQPHPLLKTLPCERTRSGAVITDAMLRVDGVPSVWAVGDCAQIPDLNAEGKYCPPTAQHALREGRLVADNIASTFNGGKPEPFRFRAIGMLVALGHRTAVAEVRGLKFSGFLAWFMWRTVYLSKLPGLEKKVRVALDWMLDLFFPRDIVLTAGTATPTLAQMAGTAPRSPGIDS